MSLVPRSMSIAMGFTLVVLAVFVLIGHSDALPRDASTISAATELYSRHKHQHQKQSQSFSPPGPVPDPGPPKKVTVGVDYYPEQWPLEDMHADMTSIKRDLGADVIRVGEFMWQHIEPADGVFNFTLLDRILDSAEEIGLEVMLGTPTATMPAWLFQAHPDVMQRGPDSPAGYMGATPNFGGRRQYSFNSKKYLEYAKRVVTQLAARYGKREVVTVWQVDNELGHEGSDLDFSDNALTAWRDFLKEAYSSLDELNAVWGTTFWSVTFTSFDQIPLPTYTIPGTPSTTSEFRSNMSPGLLLDYRRFRAQSITRFSEEQVAILRAHTQAQITTNSPGGVWSKAMDSTALFDAMHFPAYDNYPVWGGSVKPTSPSEVGLALDTVRGWQAHNSTGFMVAEQLIGAQGHDIIGYTPRPRQAVAWSAQTLLHGATSLLFFRYRAALFGQEEFCYGVLDHTTPRGTGRKFNEAKDVYALARTHQKLWLTPAAARVLLLYDVDNIFSWQAQPQSQAFDFTTEAHRLYHAFWRHGVAVDVRRAQPLPTLAEYDVLLLPAPMILSDALLERIEAFVEAGGSLYVGFRADLKDSSNRMRATPSRLASLAGVTIEEIESLNPGSPAYTVRSVDNSTDTYSVSVWREGLRLVSGTAARAVFDYGDSFFGGLNLKAVTRRSEAAWHGGEVIYMGGGVDPEALLPLATNTISVRSISAMRLLEDASVEQMLRRDADGALMAVTINHNTEPVQLHGESVPAFDIQIVPHRAA